jgi:hypothetical protein
MCAYTWVCIGIHFSIVARFLGIIPDEVLFLITLVADVASGSERVYNQRTSRIIEFCEQGNFMHFLNINLYSSMHRNLFMALSH